MPGVVMVTALAMGAFAGVGGVSSACVAVDGSTDCCEGDGSDDCWDGSDDGAEVAAGSVDDASAAVVGADAEADEGAVVGPAA
jgi:hypothetical protein